MCVSLSLILHACEQREKDSFGLYVCIKYSAVNLNLMHLCVLVRSIHAIFASRTFFSLCRCMCSILSLSFAHSVLAVCRGIPSKQEREKAHLVLVRSVCRLLDQFSVQRAEFQHILICINICICAQNPFWCYVFYTP